MLPPPLHSAPHSLRAKESPADDHAQEHWVLSKSRRRMEIFDVSDPAAPVRLGELTSGAAKAFRRRFAGPYAFSYAGRMLQVERAVPVAP